MTLRTKLLLLGIAMLVVAGLVLAGCSSGVSQEDYDAVVAERDAAKAEIAELEEDISDLNAEIADLQTQVSDLETEMAALKVEQLLPDVLTLLGVVDEIEAWNEDPADTALLGALTGAISNSGHVGLIESWNIYLAASAEGDPGMTLHQFYGYMMGQCSQVTLLFPTKVQPLMAVRDEMDAMTTALDIALLGQMTTAVNASGQPELIQRWGEIVDTFSTDLPDAVAKMIDMQVWMLGEIAEDAPST